MFRMVLICNCKFLYTITNRNRKCIAPRPNGKSCVPDSDCASGHCCGVWPFKRCRECCKDFHCGSNKFCLGRACRDCLTIGQNGCSSDAHCCNQATCCGEKNFLGIRLIKGTCIATASLCCALQGAQCSNSRLAPENLKCCAGSCQQDLTGKYICQ